MSSNNKASIVQYIQVKTTTKTYIQWEETNIRTDTNFLFIVFTTNE